MAKGVLGNEFVMNSTETVYNLPWKLKTLLSIKQFCNFILQMMYIVLTVYAISLIVYGCNLSMFLVITGRSNRPKISKISLLFYSYKPIIIIHVFCMCYFWHLCIVCVFLEREEDFLKCFHPSRKMLSLTGRCLAPSQR